MTRIDFAATMMLLRKLVRHGYAISRGVEHDMDVRNRARSGRVIFFAACLHLLMGVQLSPTQSTPLSTWVQVAPPMGLIRAATAPSPGQTALPTRSIRCRITCHAVEQYHPRRSHRGSGARNWPGATIPTEANSPNSAYSYSNLISMNNQGLAAGINFGASVGTRTIAKCSSPSNRQMVRGELRSRSGLEPRHLAAPGYWWRIRQPASRASPLRATPLPGSRVSHRTVKCSATGA